MSDDYEMRVVLARIEAKLDNALTDVMDHEARIRVLEAHGTHDHDDRIANLERWRYALPASLLTALVAVATAVAGMMMR